VGADTSSERGAPTDYSTHPTERCSHEQFEPTQLTPTETELLPGLGYWDGALLNLTNPLVLLR